MQPKTHKEIVDQMAACCLVTSLSDDVLALELANKQLADSSLQHEMPGLVRLYKMIANDMAKVLSELERAVDS